MKFITGMHPAYYVRYLNLYYYHWVDTSASGLLVPESITRPVVSVSELTWFIRYICYWNIRFQNNVIINKTKLPPSEIDDRSWFWLSFLDPLVYLLPKTFNLFGLPIPWI